MAKPKPQTNGTAYLTREQYLDRATALLEEDYTSILLGGTVRIRELTGKQRVDAYAAAPERDDEGEPTGATDEAMFRAVVIQQGTIDPTTGDLLLTPGDVPRLATMGREALREHASAILALSAMTSEALFRGDTAPDAAEQTADAGAAAGAADGG